MSITKEIKYTTELDEDGVIHLKTITCYYDGVDGEGNAILVSKQNHREVLNPDSESYSKKLATLTTKLVGQTAIDQQKVISDKTKEISELKSKR